MCFGVQRPLPMHQPAWLDNYIATLDNKQKLASLEQSKQIIVEVFEAEELQRQKEGACVRYAVVTMCAVCAIDFLILAVLYATGVLKSPSYTMEIVNPTLYATIGVVLLVATYCASKLYSNQESEIAKWFAIIDRCKADLNAQ
jgi:hypothetical protein